MNTQAQTYIEGASFEVESGKIRVIDPAFAPPERYEKLNFHFGLVDHVPNGIWKSVILTETSHFFGEVVKQIRIYHNTIDMSIFEDLEHFEWQNINRIDSYSGCCGFFDEEKFIKEVHTNKDFFVQKIIENLDSDQIVCKDNELGVFSRSMLLSEDIAHHSLAVHASKKAMFLEFIDNPEDKKLIDRIKERKFKNKINFEI